MTQHHHPSHAPTSHHHHNHSKKHTGGHKSISNKSKSSGAPTHVNDGSPKVKMIVNPTINNSQSQLIHHPNNNHNVHIQFPATTTSSSPPHNAVLFKSHKSKMSKSRKMHDQFDTPRTNCLDLIWLFVYFLGLYTFYAVFWYTLWSIYLATTPTNQPRHLHMNFNSSELASRADLCASDNLI